MMKPPAAPCNSTQMVIDGYNRGWKRGGLSRPLSSLASPGSAAAIGRLLDGHIDTFGTNMLPPRTAAAAAAGEDENNTNAPAATPTLPYSPSAVSHTLPGSSQDDETFSNLNGLDTFGSNIPHHHSRVKGSNSSNSSDSSNSSNASPTSSGAAQDGEEGGEEEEEEGEEEEQGEEEEEEEGWEGEGKGALERTWWGVTASHLTSPVAWTPASPAREGARERSKRGWGVTASHLTSPVTWTPASPASPAQLHAAL